jgi:hypothetical protein
MNLIQQILLLSLGASFILFGISILFLPEVKEKRNGNKNHVNH